MYRHCVLKEDQQNVACSVTVNRKEIQLVGKHRGKNSLVELVIDGRTVVMWILKK